MPTDQQDEKATHDPAKWLVATEIAKFEGDWTGEQIDAGEAPDPFEVLRDEGNLLVIGGVSLLWELAIGNRAAGALEYLNNANARIGVGTSSTAEVDTNTSLTGGRVQGDGRDLPDAHGFDGHERVEDDHVPVDVRERRREPGVERVGDRQHDAAAESQGGGERHEGVRADLAVHRDRHDRVAAWLGSTSRRRTRPPAR
jgi:hypothetical protein